MSSTFPRRITIVGGGIAGLTLASALDPGRFEMTLVEAEPERSAVGGGISLWPSAVSALDRVGARAALADLLDRRITTGTLHQISGRRLLTMRGPDVRILPRPRLMAALQSVLPSSVEVRAAEVTDPRTLAGDLIIGADGVRSKVRGIVAPRAAERVQTPFVALRGTLPHVDEAAVGEYWGPGLLFGLAPMGDGRVYWYAAYRSDLGPEPLDVEEVLAEARGRFSGAAPIIRDTLADAPRSTVATRMWVAPPLHRYVRDRYAVLGDAAHASLPTLGRGACDALLDAVSLADTLNAGRSLATWEARRVPTTQAARLGAGAVLRVASVVGRIS